MGEDQIYIAVTAPHGETRAVQDLTDKGLVAYSPMSTHWCKPSVGRKFKVVRSLLSRYVFVLSDDIARDFHTIRQARRVKSVVCRDGQPMPLPAKAVEWLAWVYLEHFMGAYDHTPEERPKLTIGQQVRILKAAWESQIGTVTRVSAKTAMVKVEGTIIRGELRFGFEELQGVAKEAKRAA